MQNVSKSRRISKMQVYTDYESIRYDIRCYINVHSKANISQLNLPHGTDN